MVSQVKSPVHGGTETSGPPEPRALAVASEGLDTTRSYARLGGALIHDILAGSTPANIANPVCRTANMVLRSVEVEARLNNGKPLPTI